MIKFKEKLNTAVFTTKYVIEENSPILYVYHYNDGSWQFNGVEGSLTDEDYRIVSLREILLIDETLNELADMPLGFEGLRKNKMDKWKVIPGN